MLKLEEYIPIKGEYDIVIAGGGLAGVAAALAGARASKSVLLIEKTICLGGLATIGLVNFFVPMCNGRGTQIIKGMAEEFFKMSIEYGFDTVPNDWKNGEPEGKTNQRYATSFSAPIFSLQLTKLMKKNGVKLLFDTVVSKPVMDGTHCEGLIVENKSGREFYKAEMVIDATGDADVLFRAGVPTVQGKNYYTFYGYEATLETCKTVVETGDMSRLAKHVCGGYANLYGKNHPEGMKCFTGTDVEDVTDYVVRNHIELLDGIKYDARQERDLYAIPTMCQFRTTRRIDGDYTLQVEDVYKHFDDSVGAICDFEHRDYLYEIPYRTMVKTGFDNIITAGRCVAGEGYAWDLLRVIPPAIITGQVAGTAASQALNYNEPIYNIDILTLQKSLEQAEVMIHFNDELIPTEIEESGEIVDVGHI